MCKVYDQNKLDHDKTEASDHAEDHPRRCELPLRYEESPNNSTDNQQVFNAPESVREGIISYWILFTVNFKLLSKIHLNILQPFLS